MCSILQRARSFFVSFLFRLSHLQAFSDDPSDNPPLRLRRDAAGRISEIPEWPEFTDTSGKIKSRSTIKFCLVPYAAGGRQQGAAGKYAAKQP